MENEEAEATVRGVSAVNLVLGAWLAASPYILSYTSSQARWNQIIAGVAVILLSLWRLANPFARWASWTNAAIAAWLVVAPFILGYTGRMAYFNGIIIGIVLLSLSAGNASTRIEHTHHHAM